ncbi:MAG: CDP-alcohol phosphatidyltransferase [Chloroflexi bacterium RBG_16_58_8]|nr:MAG: CDP-alcohol phosphatidyltransferase [Chloroflexi bacterium RBG_16_58_8]
MSKLDNVRKIIANKVATPIVKVLAKTPLTPNALTWIGFLVTAAATALIVTENLFVAGVAVLVAGFFDMLDGALARSTGRVTKFGAILDSSLDRICEALVLLGLLVIFAREQDITGSVLAGVTLLGSFMVSYIRARMEGMGVTCKAGFFTRPERVIVMALGLLLSRFEGAIIIALGITTLFSFITVVERLVYAWRQVKE